MTARRHALTQLCAGALAAGGLPPTRAQTFPSRTLTVVVPYPPGGGTDTFARALAVPMARTLGQSVVIDNRSGASGNIGTESVTRAQADGHTLLYAASTIALSRLTSPKLAFDPQRDLSPIAMTVSIPQVLVVHPSLTARTVAELVELSKRQPDTLAFGSGGPGSAGHFAMELLKIQSGLDARHIPYRGAAPAMNALLAGEVKLAVLVPPVAQSHLKAGKLRALAVTSARRAMVLPEVPTLQELGFKDYEALQWHGFFVPVRTPAAVQQRLHAAAMEALHQPEFKALLAQEGAEPVGNTPQAFAAAYAAEVAKWADVVRRSQLKFE